MPLDGGPSLVPTLTVIRSVPDVPEIRLRLAEDTMGLWEAMEEAIGNGDLPPPFWATAWAGGVALARYLLDHHSSVAGRDVVDVATGSGIVAIAAALGGARSVTACDVDPVAVAAAGINAELNGVAIDTRVCDVRAIDVPPGALVTAGDVFYEREIATAMNQALSELQSAGAEVLIGDPHRSFLPFEALEALAGYEVTVDPAVETVTVKETMVARLVSPPAPVTLQRSTRR